MDEFKALIATIERLEAEQRRRVDEKVERGEAVRQELVVVYGGCEDAEAILEGDKAPRIEKDSDGREIIYDPITVMYTGVPRPGLDDAYVARLDREVRDPKSEAAYGEHVRAHGAAAHEPKPYMPPPLSEPPSETPAELEWRGVMVQGQGPASQSE
jgi:hypothetical protein